MSWIKITQYLPGDSRKIQIWNEPPYRNSEQPEGNQIGYYAKETGKWYCNCDRHQELKHVTHWAEMLGKPEELNEK